MIDLLNTKDTSLVGEIGEIIARKYLWQKGISAIRPNLVRWTSWLADYLVQKGLLHAPLEGFHEPDNYEQLDELDQLQIVASSLLRDFEEQQSRYVVDLIEYGHTWGWDFVGHGRYSKDVYLIEIKTSRVGKKYRLKSSWSGRSRREYERADLGKAKSLGFKLLLVNVELLDNWQFEVSDREL